MKPSSQNAMKTCSSSSSKLSKHNKAKPKIRIVHIIPPEVIMTSVEDFCEIVQRLTGKPAADGGSNYCCTMKTSQDPMYNMLQKGYNKEKSDHGFSAWMNEFSVQDLGQYPLEVENIIDVFSKETAINSMVSKYG